MKQMLRCWAEVDLEALRGNLEWIRHQVGPRVKILTVVKADAYGHGLKQIAAHLMQSGTDFFGVANLAEARAVRSVGKGWPVLMLGACLPDEVEAAVREDVRPTISSLAEAAAFSAAAVRLRKTLPVHVKVDTGMGRLGVAPEQALELLQTTQGLPGLTLEGFYTHYSSAEDDVAFTRHQASCFRRLLKRATSVGVRIPLVHAENTAALLHGTGTTFQLVRPGVLVYGVIPSGWRVEARALQSFVRPALAWKCRVSFIKWIPQGTSLSYGNTFVAARPLQVATLTAGYGDGYLRAGSNRARVLVGGRRCRVLGRITMDQMLVDVTRVPNVAPGDEAVLLGRQGEEEITASDLAQWNRTIPWEVLTSITYRVPRIYRGSHAA
jgi:alanine racemase